MDNGHITSCIIAAMLSASFPSDVFASQDNTGGYTETRDTVTAALGIRRPADAVPYSVQTIKAEEITAKDANVIASLDGIAAGVVINKTAGGAGTAVSAVARGIKSSKNTSDVMYVIDGIPMYTDIRKGSKDISIPKGETWHTEPIADINPEDIESVTILPGASAAALYGSCAGNGAILITTRSGKADKTSVTLSVNTEFDTPLMMPKFQDKYGSFAMSETSWGRILPEDARQGHDPGKGQTVQDI